MNSFGQPSSANMNLNNIGPVTYISRPILVSPTPISAIPSGQVFHSANQQNVIHTYANGSVAAAPAIISSGHSQHQNQISIQTAAAARPAYSIIHQPGGHQALIRSPAVHPINVSFHQPSTAINSIVNSAQAASRQNMVQNVNGLPVIQVSPQGQAAMAQQLANNINVHQRSNRSPAMYPTFNPMNTGFHAEPIRKQTEANQSIVDKEPDSPENEKSIEERAKAWAAKNSTPINQQGEESHTSSKLPKLSGPPPGFEPQNKNENSESVTNNNVNKNQNEVVESEKENFNEKQQQQHIQTKTDQQASKASENAAKIPQNQKTIDSKILNETDQKTIVQNQTNAENAIPSSITTNILPTNTSSNINKQPIPISHNGGQPNIINLGNQISKIRQQLPGSLPIVRMQPVQISNSGQQLLMPAQQTISHFPHPQIRAAQPTAIIGQQPVQQIGIPMIIPGQLVPLHPGVPPPAYTQMHQSHQGAMVGTSSGFYQSIPGHNNNNQSQQFISPVGPLIVNNRPRFVTLNVSSINTNNRTGVNFSSSNNINSNNNNNFVHNNGVIQSTTNLNTNINININNNNNNIIKIKNNNNNYNTLPPNISPIENSQVKLLSSSPIDSEMSISTATSATNSYNIKVRPIALRTGYELENQKTSKQTSDNQERSIFDLEDQKEINHNHNHSSKVVTSDHSPYKLRLPLSNQMSSEKDNTTASQNTMPSLFDTIDDTDDNENENSESLSAMFSRTNSSSKSNNKLIRDINADSCVKLVNLDKDVTKNGENGEQKSDLSIFDS